MPVIPLLEESDYDFTGLSVGASVVVPIRQIVDVVPYGLGTLILRVHAASVADARVAVDVRVVAPSAEDPAVFFRGAKVATAEFQSGVQAPALFLGPAELHTGQVGIFLRVAQGPTGGTVTFTISVDLVVKEGIPEWTPSQLGSKLTLFLDRRDQVAVSGAVSDWGDQSSAGTNDFTQATAAARPATGIAINGEPAPDFDGTNDSLASNALSSFIQPSAYNAFVVMRAQTVSANSPTSYLNNPVVADGGAGWWGLFLRNNAGTLQALAFHWDTSTGERVAVASGLPLGVDTLVEFGFDGATIRCQVGGGALATMSATNVGSLVEAVKLGTGAVGAPYFDGCVVAVLVCNEYLSNVERSSARAYLSSRYGVPV